MQKEKYRVSPPDDAIDHLDELKRLTIGDCIRIRHTHKRNGESCSINKDACMMVTRYSDYYFYYCHRCKEQGQFNLLMSPEECTIYQPDTIRSDDKPTVEGYINVPQDCIPIISPHAPQKAKQWVINCGITASQMEEYKIQYSRRWDRVFFPIQASDFELKIVKPYLVGWSARCPNNYDKQERIDKQRPKWINRKLKGHERIFFARFNTDSNILILVEDVPSAIRVHEATDHNVIALLTTSMPVLLMSRIKRYDQDTQFRVWLDNDMRFKVMSFVSRLTGHGYNIKQIRSSKDPKMYDEEQIRRIVEVGHDN